MVYFRLDECKERQSALYAKQGRHRQFKSQRDRDKWIRKEVEELEQDMAKRREEVCLFQQLVAMDLSVSIPISALASFM